MFAVAVVVRVTVGLFVAPDDGLGVVVGVLAGGMVGVFVPAGVDVSVALAVGVGVDVEVAVTVWDCVSVAVGVGPAGNRGSQKPPLTAKLPPAL